MSNQYPPGGYNPPPGGAPPGGGGYNPPPPGGMPPGGMPPGGGGYGAPPGGPPGGGGYGPPPGSPPGAGGYGPPPGGPPGGMPPPGGGAVMAAPPGASPESKKGGCGGKGIIILGVLGVLFVLFLCAGGAAAAWYFDVLGALFGGGSSVAYKHLPEGCEVVAHVDMKGVMATPAVKKHVVPALDEAVQKDPDSDKLAAFFRSAQLNPKKDLHSVAICVKNLKSSDPDFLVIVGGNIRAGKVIDAFDKHSDKDKFDKPKTVGGMKVIEAKDEPVIIAQADDGAILFTNQQGLLKQAAKPGSAWKKYSLPMSEQMSVVLTKEAAQAMNDKAGPRNPLGNAAANIGRGEMSLSLDTGKIALKLEMGSESDAKEAADAINELLKLANAGPAMAGDEKDLVQSIEIKADGEAVAGTATIPEKMIEDAAKEFAKGVEEAGDEI